MSTPIRFTIADLELLPDRLDDTRYEIIDGELYVSKQPKVGHQDTCSEIVYALRTWMHAGGGGRAVLAPGVIFAADDAVAPDVIWISDERLRDGVDEGGHLRVAPELMVEVLSPGSGNARRDRDLKLRIYSRYGVQEYWIVDWQRREMAVYRREDSALRVAATLRDGDVLTSPLLPGFSCEVSSFWQHAPS